jgi:hypothetical protein
MSPCFMANDVAPMSAPVPICGRHVLLGEGQRRKSKLDEIYPPIVELEDDEYTGDKQTETEDSEG